MDSTLQEAFDRWEASFNALCRYLEDASTPTPASTPAITTDGVVGPAPASSSTAKLVAASPTPARHSLDQGTPAPDLAPTPAALTPTMKAATSCIPMSPTRCSMGGLDHNTDMDDPMASCLLPGSAPTPSPRPWLEPVPPHPPDPWSLFPGAWSGSRPEACITVHSAVNTVLLCNNTEEVPTYKVPQHEAVQRQPWPPPSEFCENLIRDELKVIFANAASFGVQHCSSNDPRGTTLVATLESQMLQPVGNLSSSVSCILAKVQYPAEIKWNFNALLLRVQEWAPKLQCVQHVRVPSYAPSWHEWHTTDILLPILVNGSVLTLLRGSPHSFRVADLLERANQLKCTKRAQSLTGKLLVEVGIRQNIEAKQPDSTPGLFLDHHSRLRSVIIGVLLTWLDFSGIQILPVASKKVNLRTDPISLQRYNSSTTCTCFGVGVFNAILLQNWLLSQFIGQTNQWGFELLQWKTARSHQWKCPAIASADLKEHCLSLKEIKGGQFVNDAIEKVSGLRNSDSSCAKVCVQTNGDDTRPLPWPSFMEGDDSETLNKAIMKQLQCCSLDSLRTEGYAAVEMKISDLCIVVRNFELKLMSIAPIPEAFVSCAKRCTFYLAGYFLTSDLMQDSAAYSIGQLFLSDPLASSIQAKFLGQAQEPSGTLLYVLKLAEVKLTGRFHEIENWWNYVLRTWLSWRLEIVIAFGTIVYTCTSLSRAYQFICDPSDGSCSCVQISVYLHITISLAGIGSLDWVAHQAGFSFAQLQWVSIALMHSCGLIRLEKLCPNWRSAHSASGRPALLIPSQSVALKNIELWCLAWSNLDNHAEQWDSALDCLFNAIKQFSSGPGLHLQQLSNLWGAYQIWLVAWALDVSEFFTSCGQAPFQGGRDVIHELSGAKQGSDLHELSLALLSVWQHAKYTQWSWDPGGCTFALYSSGKTVTTTLHSYERLQGSSLCLAYVFQTWLVAWIVDALESSTGCGQAPSQGGRNILQAEFSDQVNVCNYYLGFSLDWISIHRNCYFYLAEVYSNFYYHRNFDNVQELRVQWDPGGVLVASAWGQAEFQGGRDVRSLTCTHLIGPVPWAPNDGFGPAHSQLPIHTTNI